MANRWGNSGNSDRLYFYGLQNHCRWWLQPWNKKTLTPWKESYDQPRQHIKKQIHWRREWQTTAVLETQEPHEQIKRQKDTTLKDEPLRLEGVQYATGEDQTTITNNFRKNAAAGPKWKRRSVVNVSGSESEVQCCREQCCIGTWNVRSINQGKLDVVKQEMARVNIDILGISELKWTGMGELNSDDHYICYCGQESLRRNGVAIMVNKRVWNAVLGGSLKNDRMISVRFQGKPFNITVIQIYAPNSNAEEAEVERFYEDLQDL